MLRSVHILGFRCVLFVYYDVHDMESGVDSVSPILVVAYSTDASDICES